MIAVPFKNALAIRLIPLMLTLIHYFLNTWHLAPSPSSKISGCILPTSEQGGMRVEFARYIYLSIYKYHTSLNAKHHATTTTTPPEKRWGKVALDRKWVKPVSDCNLGPTEYSSMMVCGRICGYIISTKERKLQAS
jgi:hypothetical protein